MRLAVPTILLLALSVVPSLAASAVEVEHSAPPEPKTLPPLATDPMHVMPVLPKPQPAVAADLGALEELAPGVHIARGKWVVLDGVLAIDKGPTDGLEVLACLKDGKNHETLVRLDTTQGQLVKAACIAALGLVDGQPTDEGSGLPARGQPVSVTIRWQDGGKTVAIPASQLVRDRVVDRPFPELAWPYVGSRFEKVLTNDVTGRPQQREVFMLDATRSIVVNFDEPDALIASAFPVAINDQRFEVYSAICPPAGTPLQLVIGPAILPLTLSLATDGTLHDAQGAVLDDAALGKALSVVYGTDPVPALHTVGVEVAATAARQGDVQARARILAAAAAAKLWVSPLFVPKP